MNLLIPDEAGKNVLDLNTNECFLPREHPVRDDSEVLKDDAFVQQHF